MTSIEQAILKFLQTTRKVADVQILVDQLKQDLKAVVASELNLFMAKRTRVPELYQNVIGATEFFEQVFGEQEPLSSTESAPKGGHTPGPWVAAVTKIDEITENDVISILALSEDAKKAGHPIGVTSIEAYNDSDRANAKLIAAAPELFQGARACVTMLHSYGDESSLFAASFLTKAIIKAEKG